MFSRWKLAPNTVTQRLAALRFFYIRVLKRGWSAAETPYPKKVLHLPHVLSQEEVTRLIDAAEMPFHRILLMTLYATGARRAEVTHLKVSDIDSQRMVVHIRGGKGREDRDVMLSPALLDALRVYCAGASFVERSRRWITWQHHKVLLAITRCRTAALGGHRHRCSACGHTTAISYNSCRNRHCPRCQANARLCWLQAREQELLATRYVHLVFTLPRELAPLALQNKRVIYNLLFQASAATVLEIARDPATSARRSASSACSIPGTRGSSIIPTSTAWPPPEASLPTTRAGSLPVARSSCQSRCSAGSFAASSSPD
jgi:hypothetical protein